MTSKYFKFVKIFVIYNPWFSHDRSDIIVRHISPFYDAEKKQHFHQLNHLSLVQILPPQHNSVNIGA